MRVDVMVLDDDLLVVETLGTTYTGADGWFEFEFTEPFVGNMLLLRAGGNSSAVRLPWGEYEVIAPSDARTVVYDLKRSRPPEQLAITGWTTLIVELAREYKSAYGDSWTTRQCVDTAGARLGEHLWRDAFSDLTFPIYPQPPVAFSPTSSTSPRPARLGPP